MSDGMRGDVLELECRSLAQRLFLLAELELEPLPQDEVVRQLQGLPDVRRQFRQAYTEWRERECSEATSDWADQALAI